MCVLEAATDTLTRAKGSRKMADIQSSLTQLVGTFKLINAVYAEQFTAMKDAALRYKAECDGFVKETAERFQQLANTAQERLDSMDKMMDELEPIIRKIKQVKEEPTSTKPPAKTSRTKGRA
jgi:molecular chaperone GrpE (heat shock protein)